MNLIWLTDNKFVIFINSSFYLLFVCVYVPKSKDLNRCSNNKNYLFYFKKTVDFASVSLTDLSDQINYWVFALDAL